MFVRFSTVIHGGHSPETLRDPRGFATKFYTDDGNWDLVASPHNFFYVKRIGRYVLTNETTDLHGCTQDRFG